MANGRTGDDGGYRVDRERDVHASSGRRETGRRKRRVGNDSTTGGRRGKEREKGTG